MMDGDFEKWMDERAAAEWESSVGARHLALLNAEPEIMELFKTTFFDGFGAGAQAMNDKLPQIVQEYWLEKLGPDATMADLINSL